MSETKSLYINKNWVQGKGIAMTSEDPYTKKIIWSGKSASEEDVNDAFDSAQKSFQTWSKTSLENRIHYLIQFRTELEKKRDSFAETISKETGKPLWESKTEVGAMISKLDISLQSYYKRCETTSKEMGNAISLTKFKALGVVAVLGPYNLPGHLPNGHIIPALIAGNTILFKPSEFCPLVAEEYIKIWENAGLPAGVLNLIQGQKDTGISITNLPNLKGLFFTGSYETGRHIHKAFAGYPQKMLALEMGGNNPLIVWEPKDLKSNAYLTIQSAFITSGQRCVCARRLIIKDDGTSDQFLNELIIQTKKISIGHYSLSPEPFMGPLISKEAAQKVINSQELLIKKGAKPYLKCSIDSKHKALISPGILDTTSISDKEDKEIFGPLLQIIRVKNFQQAIDTANDTSFGLSAGLICEDYEKWKEFYSASNAGIINWNRQITGASSSAPFGGTGNSGNFRPSAFFAADYCAYPVASIETSTIEIPENTPPGLFLQNGEKK